MTRAATVLISLVLSAGLLAQTQPSASPDVLLKAAMQKEQVDGDLGSARSQYQVIIDTFPKHPAAAQALLQMAGISERQAQSLEARAILQRLVSDYPDSAPAVEARKRLGASAATEAQETRLTPTGRADGMLIGGRVSPDGRYISFADTFVAGAGGTGNLAVWDTRADRVTVVNKFSNRTPWSDGEAEDSTWSPDGRQLAYSWRVQGGGANREIRIVDRQSGRHRVVFTSADGTIRVTPFSFSPDGRQLLASLAVPAGEGTIRSAELALITLADGRKETLKTFVGSTPGHGLFSADGKYVAFDFQSRGDSPSRDIAVLGLEDRREIRVSDDATVHDTLLGWLADGHLLFSSDRNGTFDAFAIRVVNGVVAPPAVVVRRDVGQLDSRGTTRDGRVFVEKTVEVREIYVAELDTVTGKATRPPAPLQRALPAVRRGEPAWSPDGTRIAYVQSAPGVPQSIAVQSVGTGEVRVFPVQVRNIDWPLWRPDGQAFVFDGTGPDNMQRTFSLDLTSGRLTPFSDRFVFGFSPDSRSVYEGGGGNAIVRRSLSDGTTQVVVPAPAQQRATTISPDGRWLASLSARAGRGNAALSIRSTEGGEPKVLVQGFAAGYARITWSADSRYVIFNMNPGGLHRVSIDGGQPEPLGIDSRGLGMITEKSMSADGRRLALAVSRNQRELWFWRNLLPRGK